MSLFTSPRAAGEVGWLEVNSEPLDCPGRGVKFCFCSIGGKVWRSGVDAAADAEGDREGEGDAEVEGS